MHTPVLEQARKFFHVEDGSIFVSLGSYDNQRQATVKMTRRNVCLNPQVNVRKGITCSKQ